MVMLSLKCINSDAADASHAYTFDVRLLLVELKQYYWIVTERIVHAKRRRNIKQN